MGSLVDSVRDQPVGAAAVGVGIALLVYAFWDGLFDAFGGFSPSRIERRVRDWLHEERYTVTPQPVPSHLPPEIFILEIQGRDKGHSFIIHLRTIAPKGVQVISTVGFSDAHIPMIRNATRAEWRELTCAIAATATNSQGLTATTTDIASAMSDPNGFQIRYSAVLPYESLTFRSFFESIHAMSKCVGHAQLVLVDAAEKVAERDAL